MSVKMIFTRLQRLRNTDPIFYDHVIEALCEEIEKVENPYPEDRYHVAQRIAYGEACQDILALLRPIENPVGSVLDF